MRLLIGIDPGVKTGLAVWNLEAQRFQSIESCTILEAIEIVATLHRGEDIEVWFEDARLRKWFGKKGREALQGAGSIKRDCSIWEDALTRAGIKFKAIPPMRNITKVDAKLFARMTGITSPTNEHSRDAAMLVFKMKGTV